VALINPKVSALTMDDAAEHPQLILPLKTEKLEGNEPRTTQMRGKDNTHCDRKTLPIRCPGWVANLRISGTKVPDED